MKLEDLSKEKIQAEGHTFPSLGHEVRACQSPSESPSGEGRLLAMWLEVSRRLLLTGPLENKHSDLLRIAFIGDVEGLVKIIVKRTPPNRSPSLCSPMPQWCLLLPLGTPSLSGYFYKDASCNKICLLGFESPLPGT